MYLGIYDIDGDSRELLVAYDRLIAGMPEGQLFFHACAVRENGITIFDACPTKERRSRGFRPARSFATRRRRPDFPGRARSRDSRFTPYALATVSRSP